MDEIDLLHDFMQFHQHHNLKCSGLTAHTEHINTHTHTHLEVKCTPTPPN